MEGLLSKAKDLRAGLSWEKLSYQIATAVQKPCDEEKPKVKIATVRGQAKDRTLPSKKAVVKQAPSSFFPSQRRHQGPRPKRQRGQK
ncbi:hypothetical protein DITRI_Ditri05aG0035700 [Diplodiscus trichospermus]